MTLPRSAAVFVLAAIAIFFVWRCMPPQVNRARFERVTRGMSREQVIATVGVPPGDYSNGCFTAPHGARYWGYKSWLSDDGQLLVRFDELGRATDVVVCNVFSLRPGFTERVRCWLGLTEG